MDNKEDMTKLFGRLRKDGNIAVFHEDGYVATRLDANVYPVGSTLSARYDHPQGIVLTPFDAQRLGLEMEDE